MLGTAKKITICGEDNGGPTWTPKSCMLTEESTHPVVILFPLCMYSGYSVSTQEPIMKEGKGGGGKECKVLTHLIQISNFRIQYGM